ncbi:MAG: UDP-N-acetylglucosamine--LPS N-acetylglucosamine transferase [Verrucomicrobiota bacterium]
MKVLILSSSTGSGHNMRANALSVWAEKEKPGDWEVKIHYPLETGHRLYAVGVETYNVIQRNAPWAHHLYFNYLELAAMHRNPDRILNADAFMETIRNEKPDLIVSVHGHTNHGFFELARRALPDHPPVCVTYCGEIFGGYGLCKHWINPLADHFIGAVPEICEAAIRDHNMPEEKTHCGGFLLRPPFYHPPLNESEQRQFILDELKLDPDQFTLLLSTGDAGANNHVQFLNALEAASLPIQVIALCGRNQETFEKITGWSTGARERKVSVTPLAYRKDMHRLMQSVSAIVARPGTGATCESILSCCPIIHNGMGGIMPQEWITVKYCRSHGISHTIKSPQALVEKVKFFLDQPETLSTIKSKMSKITPKSTVPDLMQYLESLVRQ